MNENGENVGKEGEKRNVLLTLYNTLYLRAALEIYVEHRMLALWDNLSYILGERN